MSTRDQSWNDAFARHSAAVRRFLATAAALDEAAWQKPVGEGKWSPAQIAVHVIQTYEVLVAQLRTGEGLRVQTGWALRQFLRVAFLKPILLFRRIPPGARAPRALRPGNAGPSREDGLARLRDAASAFEGEMLARRDQKGLHLTHHLFGAVYGLRALEFVSIHTEHHARQLPERAVAARSGARE
jgi:hypothetical protein